MNGNVVTVAGYFLRSLAMTFEPGLRRFVLVPLIANISLFGLMGWLLYEVITDFYDAAMLSVPEWLQFLSWIITPLLWLVAGLMTGYASTLLVLMLTSPFHALLAEKVEEWFAGIQAVHHQSGAVVGLRVQHKALHPPMRLGLRGEPDLTRQLVAVQRQIQHQVPAHVRAGLR